MTRRGYRRPFRRADDDLRAAVEPAVRGFFNVECDVTSGAEFLSEKMRRLYEAIEDDPGGFDPDKYDAVHKALSNMQVILNTVEYALEEIDRELG